MTQTNTFAPGERVMHKGFPGTVSHYNADAGCYWVIFKRPDGSDPISINVAPDKLQRHKAEYTMRQKLDMLAPGLSEVVAAALTIQLDSSDTYGARFYADIGLDPAMAEHYEGMRSALNKALNGQEAI